MATQNVNTDIKLLMTGREQSVECRFSFPVVNKMQTTWNGTASAHLPPHLSIPQMRNVKNILFSLLFSGYVSSPRPKISDWSWFVLVVIWACVLKHIVPGTQKWDMVNIRLELPSPRPHVHTPLHHFPPPLLPPPPHGLFLQLSLKNLHIPSLLPNILTFETLSSPSLQPLSPFLPLPYLTLCNLFLCYCK